MRRAWMGLVLAGWGGLLVPAAAQQLDDPHLAMVPRTAAEVARIAGATALTGDFSKPETS